CSYIINSLKGKGYIAIRYAYYGITKIVEKRVIKVKNAIAKAIKVATKHLKRLGDTRSYVNENGETIENNKIIYEYIINYRYLGNMKVLISTKQTMDEIIAVDEAIGSRIHEMVGDNKSEVSGSKSNYRLKSYINK
ncbi:MAG: hypothetical protein ACRC68_15175, partial [Clostridium sp.]